MVVITTFRPPESPIHLEQRDVTVILDKINQGTGTLFISERTLSWQKEGEVGFSMEYPNISLHAISKDPNVYEKECVYILTDPQIQLGVQENAREGDDDDSGTESEADVSELILVPDSSVQVQVIYDAIKVCQALNPDPADVDDDEDDHLYADAEEEMNIEAEDEHQINGGSGDAIVNQLADRLQNNSVDIQYNYSNGNNDDEEFEDAD